MDSRLPPMPAEFAKAMACTVDSGMTGGSFFKHEDMDPGLNPGMRKVQSFCCIKIQLGRGARF
jgi:hypothetical protein